MNEEGAMNEEHMVTGELSEGTSFVEKYEANVLGGGNGVRFAASVDVGEYPEISVMVTINSDSPRKLVAEILRQLAYAVEHPASVTLTNWYRQIAYVVAPLDEVPYPAGTLPPG